MSRLFSKMKNRSAFNSITNPRDIFMKVLNRRNKEFLYPRDSQSEVWKQWDERRSEKDLLIKMNTGSGKTVVGLIILLSLMNENRGPAAYFVPNSYLKKQVIETAERLGISVTTDPRSKDFISGERILVDTVQRLFNAKSVFGIYGNSNGRPSIPIEYMIIDDAHACIPIIGSQFSLKIKRAESAYPALLEILGESLSQQAENGYANIKDGEINPPIPVHYRHWRDKKSEVLKVIRESDIEDKNFKWDLIVQNFELTTAVFGVEEIEIKTFLPQIDLIPSFVNSSRRIYMTATLANDASLISNLGIAKECVENPIYPSSAGDIGDRFIFSPIEDGCDITKELFAQSAQGWAKKYNVVVIVPSRLMSSFWEEYSDVICDKDSIDSVVDRLREGEHIGLIVLIGRYDGVDLPEDACRILIIDGLPKKVSLHDIAENSVLPRSERLIMEQIQRIEQGMGRGIRNAGDYCAVALLDPHLVDYLHNPKNLKYFSPGTRAQFEYSNNLLRSIDSEERDINFINEIVDEFLAREKDWVDDSKNILLDIGYENNDKFLDYAIAQRSAYQSALSGDYNASIDILTKYVNSAVMPDYEKGLIKQWIALYKDKINPADAEKIQSAARGLNNRLLKSGQEIFSPVLGKESRQAENIAKYFLGNNNYQNNPTIWLNKLKKDLTPSSESGTSVEFEEALRVLGEALGFSSWRPEVEYGSGPDNLWKIDGETFLAIEAKSEAVSSEFSKRYAGQLEQAESWVREKCFDKSAIVYPVSIFPTDLMDAQASFSDLKVLTFDDLGKLVCDFEKFHNDIASGRFEIDAVKIFIKEHRLNSKQIISRLKSFRKKI